MRYRGVIKRRTGTARQVMVLVRILLYNSEKDDDQQKTSIKKDAPDNVIQGAIGWRDGPHFFHPDPLSQLWQIFPKFLFLGRCDPGLKE